MKNYSYNKMGDNAVSTFFMINRIPSKHFWKKSMQIFFASVFHYDLPHCIFRKVSCHDLKILLWKKEVSLTSKLLDTYVFIKNLNFIFGSWMVMKLYFQIFFFSFTLQGSVQHVFLKQTSRHKGYKSNFSQNPLWLLT